MYNKIEDRFHTGGFLVSNTIPMDVLGSFIQENKISFELLANKHLKKIKEHKKFKQS